MLTFAGEELLFPTAELDAWIARNQELCDLSQFAADPARLFSARHACRSRFEQGKGLGLPVINWPSPPAPRLNTLYWPTGATRWAMGWFLATDKTVAKIVAKTRKSGNAVKGTLGIGDDLDSTTDTPVQAIDMYMLPPRPMSWTSSDNVGDLMLVPLVDERYFWQFCNLGDYEVTTSTTWDTLIARLGTQLGVTITVASNIEAAYLKPDPIDFTRRYDNAALLLDAAAWSVGRRIVRTIDGAVTCQSRTIADVRLDDNLKLPFQLLAGPGISTIGYGGDAPAFVATTFRKIKQYLLRSNGQLYTVERPAPSSTVTVANKRLTIHCAAYADYDTSDVLQNGTALGALATQIATDFYGWAGKDYDRTLAGICNWVPSGYDDAILWAFGRTCPDKGYQLDRDEEGKVVGLKAADEPMAYTRVQTLPGNTWSEINLCSDSSKEIVEPRQLGKPVRDIPGGATDDVKLWKGPAGSESVTSPAKTIKACNRGSATLPANQFVWLEGINDAQWYGGCYQND